MFETVYNMYDDPADQRDALMDLVPAIARKYGNMDSVAAAEWYEQVRHKWFDEDYTVDTRYDPDDEAMRQTVRRLAGHLWGSPDGRTPADPDAMLSGLRAAMDRAVKAGGRETIARAARNDPRRPRYARVPQGATTCAFCAMLAGRGFVYASAKDAGGDMNRYHHDCDCAIVPSWDKNNPKLKGYDPDAMYKDYLAARNTLDKENPTVQDIVSAMRRHGGYTDSPLPAASLPAIDGIDFNAIEGRKSISDAARNSNRIDLYRNGDMRYGNNCQRCVVAAEMRRRGYDVVALPAILDDKGGLSTKDKTANHWKELFRDAEWQDADNQGEIETIIDAMPKGARGTIYIDWDPTVRPGAHVFCFEKTKNGIRYYDPQTGRLGCDSYFRLKNENVPMSIARTDNLEVNGKYVTDVVENKQ